MAYLKKVFLSDLDSWNQVLEEETSNWVKSIINTLDLNNDIIFGIDNSKAVSYLIQNKLFIDFNIKDRSIKILKDGLLIGEWKKPVLKTKFEGDGTPFIEISVDTWSVKDKPNSTGKHKNEQTNPRS